jgi:CheY-like chemotaxis protein
MSQADDPAGPSPPPQQQAQTGVRPPLVLVLEDEALLALDLENLLLANGYAPVLAADGPAALAIAAQPGTRLAAAIVDLRLQGNADGREVIRRLRDRIPGLPVVVVTGFHPLAPEADLRGIGGPTARLIKPAQGRRLLQRLEDVILSQTGVG